MMENQSIHVYPNLNGGANELIIREGKALEPLRPHKIEIGGNITSIQNYLSKRSSDELHSFQRVSKEKTLVIVDKIKNTIKLECDPEHPLGTTVTAKLYEAPELEEFHINDHDGPTFTKERLLRLIRFNRYLFRDMDQHEKVLTAYQIFSAQTNLHMNDSADNRGNKTLNYAKSVQSNLPQDFIMCAPIYAGQPRETFRVEICLDVTDAGARFWFESVELRELLEERKEEIFAEQLKYCEDFVIIYK